jgi:preprotein translocase subunit Sec63
MGASSEDLYVLLGVSPNATGPEIRRCYLEMVERYHPDRHQGNPLSELAGERLREINRAYAVLGDPKRRANYDAGRGTSGGQGAPHGASALRWLGLLLVVVLAVRVIPIVARGMVTLIGSGTGAAAAAAILAAVVVGLVFWRRSRRTRRN